MTRPLLEVADIVRAQGDRFIKHNFRWVSHAHRRKTFCTDGWATHHQERAP